MNKIKLLLLVVAVASLSAFVTTRTVQRLGPFYTSTINFDSTTGAQVGGETRMYLAADSVKIGDAVYLSADNTVNRSTTRANYNALAGIVVGGARQSNSASIVAADVGTLAATANQRVIVLRRGRTWVRNDSSATIAAGNMVVPSDSVKGKVEAKPATIDSLYRVIGRVAVGGFVNLLLDVNVK